MRIINFAVLLISAFIQMMTILTSELTLEFLTSVLPMILPTLGFMMQMYLRIRFIDKLKKLFEYMWDDWALQKTHDEIKIMYEHAETTKLWTLGYFSFYYLAITIYSVWLFTPEILDIISPINESRPRIQLSYMRFELFIDEDRYFYFIRFYICIMSFVTPLISMACSTLFVVFTQHVCAMCELLGYRAERLFCTVGNRGNRKKCNLFCETKINCEKITVFVRLHNNIIEFIGTINSYYTVPCLMDLVGFILLTGITVFQILSAVKIEQAIRSIILTSMLLCHMFMHNYMGDKVTDKSSNVCEKVYNSAWYDTLILEQKLLLLIIRRRSNPLVLSAWFYIFSLSNFGLTNLRTFLRQT
ncbi:odorant receptor 22c-like isoform X2 [Camponotus floridanus]|uniref:odorant receptor 22c-like isoform X2 n=1 Tax=Camponotus floridanus TaxID=104421 RepID=UPI000DC6C0BB|nr:odorant receptor 22c-like isoform X2 [Camponotus floridanus]